MRKKELKGFKNSLHEKYIDKVFNKGISKPVIYKALSEEFGYPFHCADIKGSDNKEIILSKVKKVIEGLDYKYRNL